MIEQVINFTKAFEQFKGEVLGLENEDGNPSFDLNSHLVIRSVAQKSAKMYAVPYYELYEALILDLLREQRKHQGDKLERARGALCLIAVQDHEDEEPAGAQWLGNHHDAHTLAVALECCAAIAREAIKDIGEE